MKTLNSLMSLVGLFFGLVFPGILLASDSSAVNLVESLKVDKTIDPTLGSVLIHFKNRCYDDSSQRLISSKNMQNLCESLLSTKICQSVPSEKRMSCQELQSSPDQLDLWTYLVGCTNGLLDSVESVTQFISDLVEWSWGNVTSDELRSKNIQGANEHIQVVKLYLRTEYAKAYAKQEPPFKKLKALQAMGGSLSRLVVHHLTEQLSQKVHSFPCYKKEFRSQIICKYIGEVFASVGSGKVVIKGGQKFFDYLF